MSEKLSEPQLRMLRAVRDHGNTQYGLVGNSAWGGAGHTLDALQRRSLLNMDCQLTDAGHEALASHQ